LLYAILLFHFIPSDNLFPFAQIILHFLALAFQTVILYTIGLFDPKF
jgi:hypothetical protein